MANMSDSVSQTPTVRCWNGIGVWGKQQPKCERLREVIHCRNCDVFTAAGRAAFERAVSADFQQQWRRRYADKAVRKSQADWSIVTFRLGAEWYAIPTKHFKQVAETRFIHRIPHVPDELILGLVNVGGNLRLCFSLGRLLGAGGVDSGVNQVQPGVYRRMLVLSQQQRDYVFPVDAVGGVIRINRADLQAAPTNISSRQKDIIVGTARPDANYSETAVLVAERLFARLEESIGG